MQKEILNLITLDPTISFKQLGQVLKMTEKGIRVQRSKMEINNIFLVREGSTKAGRWRIEYRLP